MGLLGKVLPGLRKPVPATVTPEEEISGAVMAVKRREAVQKGLERAMALIRESGAEYSGWVPEDT